MKARERTVRIALLVFGLGMLLAAAMMVKNFRVEPIGEPTGESPTVRPPLPDDNPYSLVIGK